MNILHGKKSNENTQRTEHYGSIKNIYGDLNSSLFHIWSRYVPQSSETQQIISYLTIASPETLDVFNSFRLNQADEAKLQERVTEIRTLLSYIRKWNAHKRNIFYQRIQKESDIIKVFVTDLKLKSNREWGEERREERRQLECLIRE